MGKFRSKLKGQTKGKRWQRGQSSNSNPSKKKYRDLAKSRFFQENLGNTGLTQDAVIKHNAITTYSHIGSKKTKSDFDNAESIISRGFENMSVGGEGNEISESDYTASAFGGTFKTFQTFASDWSSCSNISFSKLMNKFDSNNVLHKEMLAILAAVTEVIKDQGGSETATEYFAALMETLKATEADEGIAATVSLLSMGIKTVPQPVLRKQFSDSATIFTDILEKYASSDHNAILRGVIGCLSVLMRAQEYALWGNSSTMKIFESVLAFSIHSKPKVRKAAQHAVTAILCGSCFMLPPEEKNHKVPKLHPASGRVAEFCLAQMKAEALLTGHRTVLHTLALLRPIIPVFSKDNIKLCCESILSLMTHNSIYIRTCCLHTLHALLSAESGTSNATAVLVAQLLRALLAARPSAGDSGQMLAWTAVVQQACACLAGLDLNLCLPNLPAFVNVCVDELWQSNAAQINAAATNALKVILMDCVKPAIQSEDAMQRHRNHVEAVYQRIGAGLDNPFNQAIKHVILTIAVCFEISNESVSYLVAPLLKQMNDRRESHNFVNHKEMEYATGCAVKSLGPQFILTCIPLRDSPQSINIERSWLLPVLKDKISDSTLKFFSSEILEMATMCRKKSRELAAVNDIANSHTYDLLCNQLWSLLPSFCNSPTDIKDNFKAIARVLGNILKDNPEFRLSVMQGLRRLISCSVESENADDVEELGRFAKNFLPRLLNVYMTPGKGSTMDGHRLAALETIQVYLILSAQSLREELFINSLQQLSASQNDHFQCESLLDVLRLLVLYQDADKITSLFEQWVYPLCDTIVEEPRKPGGKKMKEADGVQEMELENREETKKVQMKYKERVRMLEMEHKKAYRILEEILKCEKDNCKTFLAENSKKIKKLLMSSLSKAADSSKAVRLRCIEQLTAQTPNLTAESKLVKSALAEAVLCTRHINTKCRTSAFSLITAIGNVLKDREDGLQSYITLLSSGLQGPPHLVAASVRALASAVYGFSEQAGLAALQRLLETVCGLMVTASREVVNACLSFLKVYTKILPTPVLAGSLPLIFTTFSNMTEDCKRHSRTEIGYFLTRMLRKYGADTIEKLIPNTDEIMHKRLRNIRKIDNRKKRQRDVQRTENSDSDSEFQVPVKGTTTTLEDILRDSDSDMEFLDDDDGADKRKKRQIKGGKDKKKNRAWIQDDPENIVDLADISAARKITATDPKQKKAIGAVTQSKKKDERFKTAADGRLIITDDASGSDDDERGKKMEDDGSNDSDSDAGSEMVADKASKMLKAGRKRHFDDILSVRSGRSSHSRATTAVNSKYQAGGRGIHRPINSAASAAGTEYSAKKAKGDVKKKGKPDPYAYMPMSRKNLNKRKRFTGSNQFKGVVKNKTKGMKLKKSKGKHT